jgi:hypothetical protein
MRLRASHLLPIFGLALHHIFVRIVLEIRNLSQPFGHVCFVVAGAKFDPGPDKVYNLE